MLRLLLFFLTLPAQIFAADAQTDQLIELMRFDLLAQVTHEEGIAANATMLEDFDVTGQQALWLSELNFIFDQDRAETDFRDAFIGKFNRRSMDEALAFLSTEAWIKAFALQTETSLLLVDPDTEASAIALYWEHVENGSLRADLTEELVTTADLVEQNMAGSMNSMIAFNRGMGMVSNELAYPEDELFSLLLEDEMDMRDEISEWLHAYFLVAYLPLSESEIEDQIAFWETQAGQDLSLAMMHAYDVVHGAQATALGISLASVLITPAL